jgi:sugar phosphate permease
VAVAGSSIALILVGLLVPALLSLYGDEGWRTAWLVFGGVTLVLAAASLVVLRDRPTDKGLTPIGAAVGLVPAGGQSEKLRWSQVYRSWAVWHLGLVYVAFGFSYIIYMTFFVKYLVAEGGYSQAGAGRLFMLMGWASLVCGLLWGTASDIVGRKWALAGVFLVHACAFGLFGLWPSPVLLVVSAVLFGLSAWSIPAIMAAACADALGSRLAPAALGFITLFFGTGQAIGPAVAGRMADYAGSFRPAFVLAAAVALVGLLGAVMLRKVTPAVADVQPDGAVRPEG